MMTFRSLALCGMLFSMPCFAADVYDAMSISYTGGAYENATFEYRLMRPQKLVPGQQYPLVVFLHGAGERGEDNAKQLKYLPELMAQAGRRQAYPCFLLAPQCRSGKQWVDVPWSDKQSTPMAKQPTDQLQAAIAMLDRTLKEEPVDARRVYLTGLSMGGYGTWELAARQPQRFAAVVPICGGGDERQASRLSALPIWAFHGAADNVVFPIRSQKMVDAIRAAGGKIQYTQYPGVGHNSWNQAYRSDELLKWLFAQRRKP